ncbi:ABC transporter permease [Paenarthrobacter nicotinovorans]|uniref:ABC transporter permease n=1 Tax=Paenarthrobacter nicotinovorans TaxID=29320 RepID=UPI003D67B9E6
MTMIEAFGPTLLGVVLLVALTAVVLTVYRVPYRWAPALAIPRGTVQLMVISVILSGVISSPSFVAAALLVMFAVAAMTATRRMGWSWKNLGLVGGSMGLGVAVTLEEVERWLALGRHLVSQRWSWPATLCIRR